MIYREMSLHTVQKRQCQNIYEMVEQYKLAAVIFAQSIEAKGLSREWICSWSSAYKQCFKYIQVINSSFAY